MTDAVSTKAHAFRRLTPTEQAAADAARPDTIVLDAFYAEKRARMQDNAQEQG